MNKKILTSALIGIGLFASCSNSQKVSANEDCDMSDCITNTVDEALAQTDNKAKDYKAVSKTFNLKNFSGIKSEGVADIVFVQEKDYKVKATGADNLVNAIRIVVRDNTLCIDYKHDVRTQGKEKIIVYVSAPDLKKLDISGACNFGTKDLETDGFSMDFSGAAKCSISSLKCKEANMDFSGASKCSISSLKCKEADMDFSGASKFAINVNAEELKMESSGAVNGKVRFKGDKMDIDNSGAGRLTIDVDCKLLKSENSGAANLKISGTADKTDINNSGVSKTDTKELNNY